MVGRASLEAGAPLPTSGTLNWLGSGLRGEFFGRWVSLSEGSAQFPNSSFWSH